MVACTRAKLHHLFKIDFVRFCIVGGLGFFINLALLTLFKVGFGLPIFLSQLLAAEIALFCNFMLHHHWTYRAARVDKSIPALILQFHMSSWPAIIGSAMMVTAAHNLLGLNNVWALAVSSMVALGWNYFWSKFIIWKNVTEKEVERIAS